MFLGDSTTRLLALLGLAAAIGVYLVQATDREQERWQEISEELYSSPAFAKIPLQRTKKGKVLRVQGRSKESCFVGD